MNKAMLVIMAILVVAGVGAGAYYAGTKVGESRAQARAAQSFRQRVGGEGMPSGFGPGGGGQFPGAQGTPQAGQRATPPMASGTMGTVVKIDGTTITLTTDSGTLTVVTSDTTLIQKQMSVDVADLQEGEQVIVTGSKDAQGNLVARSIQSMTGVMGRFSSAATPAASR